MMNRQRRGRARKRERGRGPTRGGDVGGNRDRPKKNGKAPKVKKNQKREKGGTKKKGARVRLLKASDNTYYGKAKTLSKGRRGLRRGREDRGVRKKRARNRPASRNIPEKKKQGDRCGGTARKRYDGDPEAPARAVRAQITEWANESTGKEGSRVGSV